MEHNSCEGCKNDLGGGRDNCRLNLSFECRDGGGFEAWEPEDAEPDQAPDAHSTPKAVALLPSASATSRRGTFGSQRRAAGRCGEPQCGQCVFLIFFGLTCALIGAIIYKLAVML